MALFTVGTSTGIFSQPALGQAQAATQQALQTQLMINAVQAPGIHPDERDITIMKFNLLQAHSGTGQGVASHLGQPGTVQLTSGNPFCRFKVSLTVSIGLFWEAVQEILNSKQ